MIFGGAHRVLNSPGIKGQRTGCGEREFSEDLPATKDNMDSKNEKVDNLKKITLTLEGGTAPDKMDLTPLPVTWQIIFGTGSEGMTPFEYEIANRSIDDEILIPLTRDEIPSKFQHLAQFILENIETRDFFYLKVRIANISNANSREVVKALAENVKHGNGCGCGCNGH